MTRYKITEVMAAAICGPNTPCEACRNSAARALSALQANGAQRMTWKEAVTHYAGNVMRSAS